MYHFCMVLKTISLPLKQHPKPGRPTKYTSEILKKLDQYIDSTMDDFDQWDRLVRVRMVTAEGFARYLGIHRDTLYALAKEHEDYGEALYRLKVEQFERLVNGALRGDYKPGIAKLFLSVNHGVREERELSGGSAPKVLPARASARQAPDGFSGSVPRPSSPSTASKRMS